MLSHLFRLGFGRLYRHRLPRNGGRAAYDPFPGCIPGYPHTIAATDSIVNVLSAAGTRRQPFSGILTLTSNDPPASTLSAEGEAISPGSELERTLLDRMCGHAPASDNSLLPSWYSFLFFQKNEDRKDRDHIVAQMLAGQSRFKEFDLLIYPEVQKMILERNWVRGGSDAGGCQMHQDRQGTLGLPFRGHSAAPMHAKSLIIWIFTSKVVTLPRGRWSQAHRYTIRTSRPLPDVSFDDWLPFTLSASRAFLLN